MLQKQASLPARLASPKAPVASYAKPTSSSRRKDLRLQAATPVLQSQPWPTSPANAEGFLTSDLQHHPTFNDAAHASAETSNGAWDWNEVARVGGSEKPGNQLDVMRPLPCRALLPDAQFAPDEHQLVSQRQIFVTNRDSILEFITSPAGDDSCRVPMVGAHPGVNDLEVASLTVGHDALQGVEGGYTPNDWQHGKRSAAAEQDWKDGGDVQACWIEPSLLPAASGHSITKGNATARRLMSLRSLSQSR